MAIRMGEAVRLPAGVARAESTLTWCEAKGRSFFVLRQRGSFPNICYDHGRLLCREIETGIFPEILDSVATALDLSPDDSEGLGQRLASAVYRRLSDDVFESASQEFRVAMEALAAGYADGHPDPRFKPAQVRDAVVAIDVGNLATGFARRMEKWGAPEVSEDIVYAVGALRRFMRRATDADEGTRVEREPERLARAMQRFRRAGRPGMGCTGFAAGGGRTADGRMLHGRTFDGAFFAWNDHPGLFLIDERESNPDWLPYAAVGTAGLPYPGGISGLNAAGLSVSLHQMSTVRYATGAPYGRWDIAPFVMQRILREARTLEEAIGLVEETRHFAAWTMLVADAKAGRALRIEISGGLGKVVALDAGETIAQTNHFLAPALAETHDWFADAHFTPTFGKWLETRARMQTVAPRLASAAGQIDTDWAIDMLADHEDGALGGDLRSFGRTVVKAYGIAAHLMRADPRRRRGMDEVWLTIGDRRPGPHATMAGFTVDFEALSAVPVESRALRRAATASPERERAFAAYVEAFMTLARPRGLDGRYLGRDPTPAERKAYRSKAIGLLDSAVEASEDAGVLEIPSRYIRARLCHEAGRFDRAAEDWRFLLSLWEGRERSAFQLHPYEAACVHALAAVTEAALGRAHLPLLEAADKLFARVIKQSFPTNAKPHVHLKDWQKLVAALKADPKGTALPEVEFVTVE